MTDIGPAVLIAGFICLLFAAIAMIYYADRVRSDVLENLRRPSKDHGHFRRLH